MIDSLESIIVDLDASVVGGLGEGAFLVLRNCSTFTDDVP